MTRRMTLLVTLSAFALLSCAQATWQSATEGVVWPPQAEPAAVRVLLSRDAAAYIDRLATLTRATRREQAACVVDYATAPLARGRWLVALIALDTSASYASDSLRVWTRSGGEFCARGVPNVHTHVVPNEVWGRPSDYDTLAARDWPTVPFRVVVSVPAHGAPKVTVYGVRR